MLHRSPVIVLISAALVAAGVSCNTSSGDPEDWQSSQGDAGGAGGGTAQAGTGGTSGHPADAALPTEGGWPNTAVEACDGVDNNTNGQVDEGCVCTPGNTQPCYPGPAQTRNVGACRDGAQTCEAAGESVAWSACEGAITPSLDVPDGEDNDCNGTPDDSDCAPDKPVDLEVCQNGLDDDCDGLADCDDPDCPPCNEASCSDGLDNDTDGRVDCLDPDCPPCVEICGDGKDNDFNGWFDCADPACPCSEDCTNGVDDDGNMLVDCDDPVCQPCHEGNCADGIDNDSDGFADCQDPDCGPCQELCHDGKDNDYDGLVDAADPDCSCAPDGECCDGVDNDGDGWIDEGQVCRDVGEPCPPGAYQECDCYCGVSRRCQPDGTWGPCFLDGHCSQPAGVSSHDQCGPGYVCDTGQCWPQQGGSCYHPGDCPLGQVCDEEVCVPDHFHGAQCP